jgi:hypothetical protein
MGLTRSELEAVPHPIRTTEDLTNHPLSTSTGPVAGSRRIRQDMSRRMVCIESKRGTFQLDRSVKVEALRRSKGGPACNRYGQ